jgi:hypothetical protein
VAEFFTRFFGADPAFLKQAEDRGTVFKDGTRASRLQGN